MPGIEIPALIAAYLALVIGFSGVIFAAPFFFDRIGWRLPGIPPLSPPPPPRTPFLEGSEEMLLLEKIRLYSEVIGMLAIIQNSDKSSHTLTELLDEYEKLADQHKNDNNDDNDNNNNNQ